MVSIHNPLRKRHVLNKYSDIEYIDKRSIKKAIKTNSLKKRNNLYGYLANDFTTIKSFNEEMGKFKRNGYSFSQFEEKIIPKSQKNAHREFKKSKTFADESEFFTNNRENEPDDEVEEEDEDSLEFQYGSFLDNEKGTACMKHFLSDWSNFISDLDCDDESHNMTDSSPNVYRNMKGNNNTKESIPNNSGYITPSSQKDDDSYYGKNIYYEASSSNDDGATEEEKDSEVEEEIISQYSPMIIDDFDDICPFENDDKEDERVRGILNSEVLPNDYIGKIPSIPEKPMGNLGRLMKKYKF